MQIYLGTTRLQLEHKGDTHHTVTSISNIVPVAGFLYMPIITWLLDSKGYGITMGTINFLGVLASLFQAMPDLWFQVRLSKAFLCLCLQAATHSILSCNLHQPLSCVQSSASLALDVVHCSAVRYSSCLLFQISAIKRRVRAHSAMHHGMLGFVV